MADSDLSHHYKVLKQFLDISDDSNSRAKSNSSRAARAREKLLRLSGAQFRELSTDVYDELRRRIDESRSEPDFLLPKSTFHPKRNQARQKLSSLPQSRFKDLVSDISFEIERRNLHTPSVSPESPGPRRSAQESVLAPAPRGHAHSRSQSTVDTQFLGDENAASPATGATTGAAYGQKQSQSQNQSAHAPRDRNSALSNSAMKEHAQNSAQSAGPSTARSMSFGEKLEHPATAGDSGNSGTTGLYENVAKSSALRDELATPDLRTAVTEKAIGIQPTTVIPTKASMTWSSDEEDTNDDFKDSFKEKRRSGFHEEPRQLGLANAFSGQGSTYPGPQPPQSSQPEQVSRSAPVIQKPSVSTEEHDDLIAAYERLRKEHDSLISDHADTKRELEELASTHADAKVQLAESVASHQSASKELGDLNESHSELSVKNQELNDLIKQLQAEKDDLISRQASAASPDAMSALKAELEEAKASTAALRLENQNLKTARSRSNTMGSTSREVQPQTFGTDKSHTGSRSDISGSASREVQPQTPETGKSNTGSIEINAELKKLHDKLDSVSSEPSPGQSSLKEIRLQNEISQWQSKYESLKAGELYNLTRNPVNSMDLTKFRSPNGVLSYKTAVELFSSIDLFYASLDISNPDPDLFFERISSIAISANKVASQSKKQVLNDSGHAEAIRESANHALTATRYYIIYPTLMPKVIVERAVSEIAFAVCDSIAALKFNQAPDSETPYVEEDVIESSRGNTVIGDEISVKPLKIPQKTQPYSSKNQSEEQVSGAVTPRRSSRSSVEASQFSPIQSKAKGQSSPTHTQGIIPNVSKPANSESKSQNNGKLSFRNFFGTKSDDGAVPTSESPGEIPERSLQRGNEAAINGKHAEVPKEAEHEKVSSKSNTPNILEKVRKFEAGNMKKSSDSGESISTTRSPSVNSGKPSESDINTSSNNELKSSPSSIDGGPSRNKSIFQSLRERFTTDSATKLAKPSGDDTPNNGKEPENTDADHSLEKIDTPSKSNYQNSHLFIDKAGSIEDHNVSKKVDSTGSFKARIANANETANAEVLESASSISSSNYATGVFASDDTPVISTKQKTKPNVQVEDAPSNYSTMGAFTGNRDRALISQNGDSSTETPFNPTKKESHPKVAADGKYSVPETEFKPISEKSVPSTSGKTDKHIFIPATEPEASSKGELMQVSSVDSRAYKPDSSESTPIAENSGRSRTEMNTSSINARAASDELVNAATRNLPADSKNYMPDTATRREVVPTNKTVDSSTRDPHGSDGFNASDSTSVALKIGNATAAITNKISSMNERGNMTTDKDMDPKSKEVGAVASNVSVPNFEKVTGAISNIMSSKKEGGDFASSDGQSSKEKAFPIASDVTGSNFEKATAAVSNTTSSMNERAKTAASTISVPNFEKATDAISNIMSSKKETSSDGRSSKEKAFSMASDVTGPKLEKATTAMNNNISSTNEKLKAVANNFSPPKNENDTAGTSQPSAISKGSSSDSFRRELVSSMGDGQSSKISERKKTEVPEGSSGVEKKPQISDLKNKFMPSGSPASRSVSAESNSKSIEPNLQGTSKLPFGLKMKSPSFKVRKVNYQDSKDESTSQASDEEEVEEDSYDEEEDEIKQRQDYRKSMAAATFNFDLFDIDDPDNTVTQVLLYLEHQTVQVISTIQDLLSAIKKPDATRGELRENSSAISEVIKQMTEATNTSMNQTRNFEMKEHGGWVVRSLEDCNHRMKALCKPSAEKEDSEFADRHFKQRLAGISFDIAKCTKELVKTVEEASLKEDIAHLDARLNHPDDLT